MERNEMIEKIFIARGMDLYSVHAKSELLEEEEKTNNAFMDAVKDNKKLKELYYKMHFAELAVWTEEADKTFCEGVRLGAKLMLDILYKNP